MKEQIMETTIFNFLLAMEKTVLKKLTCTRREITNSFALIKLHTVEKRKQMCLELPLMYLYSMLFAFLHCPLERHCTCRSAYNKKDCLDGLLYVIRSVRLGVHRENVVKRVS